MKARNIVLAGLLSLIGISLPAPNYGNYQLYADYDFESGKAEDKTGNTQLTLGAGVVIGSDPVRGKILSFTKTGNGRAKFDLPPYKGDTLSISLWVKRYAEDSSDYWKQIFHFLNPADGSNIYLCPLTGWGNNTSSLICDSRTFVNRLYENTSGTEIKADGTWQHIAVVIDGQQWSYYKNGELASSKEFVGRLSFIRPTEFHIGSANMLADMDDIRIYHYPLSASQIQQLYTGSEISDPVIESDYKARFRFEGSLKEEYNAMTLAGSNYQLVNDKDRGRVVLLEKDGQLNFSASPIVEGPSTTNFLYKKDTFTDEDNGKYLYQCSNAHSSYGIKLEVKDGTAKIVLETDKQSKTGSSTLNAGEWNAISIYHTITEGTDNGIMRVYLNGKQTTALSRIATYSLNYDRWSIGANNPEESAGGYYDEWESCERLYTSDEVAAYYTGNTTSIEIKVDYADTRQTIRNFGSADAWDAELIGTDWPAFRKEAIAEVLFSKELHEDGTPKGIGLSCWRFNIGAGSAEQGDASGIGSPNRRTECFLNADGTYNWSKQPGQQFFLRKAAEYGVEDLVGFLNAPPVFFNRDGVAFNKGGGYSSILKTDKYDEYADFLAEVVKHFNGEGIHFDYISPLNEPQNTWSGGSQEGSPWTDTEISNVVKTISKEFDNEELDTEIMIAEAASLDKGIVQIPKFWGNAEPDLRIAGLPKVANIVAAHSYWSDKGAQEMHDTRMRMLNAINAVGNGLEFMQSEYSLLNGGYTWGHPGGTPGALKEIEVAMSLARMIHADLVVGNATGWQWWTTFSPAKHQGEARFSLIEALLRKDKTDGVVNANKMLYALGHYSRFVRPGMQRVALSRSDNKTEVQALASQMFSSYINPETHEVVVVAVNSAASEASVKLSVDNMPESIAGKTYEFTPYLTIGDKACNLKAGEKLLGGDRYILPPLSLVTFAGRPIDKQNTQAGYSMQDEISCYPNPAGHYVHISGTKNCQSLHMYDISGNLILSQCINDNNLITLPLDGCAPGVYFIKLSDGQTTKTLKIIKK